MDHLKTNLETLAPTIAQSLEEDGYYTSDDLTALFDPNEHTAQFILETLRSQAEALRDEGRYEQSWSESIDAVTGKATRFDKPGVFACEPDGADYETAPDLVSYMATLISTLPVELNRHLSAGIAQISNQAFNAKLAVTCPNSEYPLHVDNSLGLPQDTRKLTCILYLNPEFDATKDLGALQLHLLEDKKINVDPSPGRWLLFWTDEIPHKVLKTGQDATDRYALTVWLADEDPVSHIHNPRSKFAQLRLQAFEAK